MSHRSDSTRNFRDDYRVEPSASQRRDYQRHQQEYQRMPSGTYDDLRRAGDAVDRRRDQYEDRRQDRIRVERETEPARMARLGRDNPDIQRVRNARNREERSLRNLEHEQRRYNDRAGAQSYANTINDNHRNMTQVASGNRLPAEMVRSVTRHADVPSYPQQSPGFRYQKEADRLQRRDY